MWMHWNPQWQLPFTGTYTVIQHSLSVTLQKLYELICEMSIWSDQVTTSDGGRWTGTEMISSHLLVFSLPATFLSYFFPQFIPAQFAAFMKQNMLVRKNLPPGTPPCIFGKCLSLFLSLSSVSFLFSPSMALFRISHSYYKCRTI